MVRKKSLLGTMWLYRMRYLFLLPALVLIIGVKYYCFVTAIIKSFYNWDGLNHSAFIGFGNYIELFSDARVHTAFRNVFLIAAAMILINLVMPLLAAELVSGIRHTRLQNFFKMGFIMPMVVPGMVINLMWRWIYWGNNGILNKLLEAIGLGHLQHNWLAEVSTALPSLIFVGFPWIAGLPFLLYLAGLMSIPAEVLESAELDGVNHWQRLTKIDLPMIMSQLKLVVIYVMIQAFQTFELSYALTKGGPGYTTTVPTLLIYDQAFNYSRFGYSAAIGVVLFLAVLILTIINQKVIHGSEATD